MALTVEELLRSARDPRYTGENRCTPCTLANLVIASLLSALAGYVAFPAVGSFAVPVAVLLFAGCVAVVGLRGYLIPGTPALTKRYVPERVLRYFDGHAGHAPAEPVEGNVDVEALLRSAGTVEECEEWDDLCLVDSFRADWRDRIEAVRSRDVPDVELARTFTEGRDQLEVRAVEDRDGAFVAVADGRWVGQWESRAAFLADVAAEETLRSRSAEWPDLDVELRSRALNGLRLFLERCPSCDGPVTLEDDVVESCCRSVDVVAATCDDCGARLFENERPTAA